MHELNEVTKILVDTRRELA